MKDASTLMVLVAAVSTACGGTEVRLRNALDTEPIVDEAVDPEAPPVQVSNAVNSTTPLTITQDEIDLLDDLGLGLGDDPSAYNYGLGQVVVTPAAGTPIVMDAVAIQLQSDDRFWDNTLVYAWSGLDVNAGTADYLLRFRAAGIADPAVQPLDALSNAMLPTWIIFSDEAADTTYYNEDGTLTIDAVTLDPTTEVPCTAFSENATCSTGTLEGDIDMSTLGYAGFGANYQAPNDRGVSTSTLDLTATFDLPVQRASIPR
ncbi:MAG: hypothetical protein AAF211_09270 [Myxococcota bacterium]